MTEVKADKDITCDRFVAFLDIMGFRERVFREKPEDIKKMFMSLRPTLENLEVKAKEGFYKKRRQTFLKIEPIDESIIFPVSFSDSIILISKDGTSDSARSMLSTVYWILSEAIEKEIPMKGAVAYGEFTADIYNSIYFGKPLIDAYELQQEILLYGAILHHTCEKRLSELNAFKNYEGKLIFKYSIPMKSGKITHYILDWTEIFDLFGETSDVLNKLYNNVSGSPRIYVDNTIDFVNWLNDEKAKLAQKKGTFISKNTRITKLTK